MDIDNLENCTDFITSVKRGKENVDPCQTPVKRRRISKKSLIDAARADEEEKANEQSSAMVKKAKLVKAAKEFVSDEAEEEQDDGRIIAKRNLSRARWLQNDNPSL